MKLENLETAVRFKQKLDTLNTLKKLIEAHPSGQVVFNGGLQRGAPSTSILDDCLNGVIYKYCEDTIKQIEKAIAEL